MYLVLVGLFKTSKKITLFIGLYSDSDETLRSDSGSISSDCNYFSEEDIETSSEEWQSRKLSRERHFPGC